MSTLYYPHYVDSSSTLPSAPSDFAIRADKAWLTQRLDLSRISPEGELGRIQRAHPAHFSPSTAPMVNLILSTTSVAT